MHKFGLSIEVIKRINGVFKCYPKIVKVVLYGSRAKGTFKDYSDIDLAVDAPAMNQTEFSQLWGDIEETNIIYKIDLLWLQALRNEDLLNNIKQDGKLFYDGKNLIS